MIFNFPWAQIFRGEEDLSCFDFLEENACTAIVSQWAGPVAVVDRRTPGVSSELAVDIGFRRTRTVHVHPVKKQYFLAAGSMYVAQTEQAVFSVVSVLGRAGAEEFLSLDLQSQLSRSF